MNVLWHVWMLLAPLTLLKEATGSGLWCYHCNVNLTKGHDGECNDPYAGPAIDLLACPENQPHRCLKALVYYKNVHVTIRSCVPSKSRSTYCKFHDTFPDAKVSCSFCEESACNQSLKLGPSSSTILSLTTLILARHLHALV